MTSPDDLAKIRSLTERTGALTSVIQSYDAEIASLEIQKKDLPLQALERRIINSKIRLAQDRINASRTEQRNLLKEIKTLAADTRREEAVRYYSAMRISKFGVRGDEKA